MIVRGNHSITRNLSQLKKVVKQEIYVSVDLEECNLSVKKEKRPKKPNTILLRIVENRASKKNVDVNGSVYNDIGKQNDTN